MNAQELGKATREKQAVVAHGQQGSPYMQGGPMGQQSFGGFGQQSQAQAPVQTPGMSQYVPQRFQQQFKQQPGRTWGQWWNHVRSPQGRNEYHQYQTPDNLDAGMNYGWAAMSANPAGMVFGPLGEAASWGLYGMPSKAQINDVNRPGSYMNAYHIDPDMSAGEKFRRVGGAVAPWRWASGMKNVYHEAQKGQAAHQANKPEAIRNMPWIHKDWF